MFKERRQRLETTDCVLANQSGGNQKQIGEDIRQCGSNTTKRND